MFLCSNNYEHFTSYTTKYTNAPASHHDAFLAVNAVRDVMSSYCDGAYAHMSTRTYTRPYTCTKQFQKNLRAFWALNDNSRAMYAELVHTTTYYVHQMILVLSVLFLQLDLDLPSK